MRYKKSEQLITSSFDYHLIKNDFPNIRYQLLDFYQVFKNQKYELVNPTNKTKRWNKKYMFFLFVCLI